MAASGALEFDGQGWFWEKPLKWVGLLDPKLFTIVTKTITRHGRTGNLKKYNPLSAVRFLNRGVVNAMGLTNPGLDWWCKEIGPKLKNSPLSIIVSIQSDSTREAGEMAWRLNQYNIKGIELNLSCPNIPHDKAESEQKMIDIIREIKRVSRFPIIIKLRADQDYRTIAKKSEFLIEAISINSVPWKYIYGEEVSPFYHLGGGGVSGKPAQEHNWNMLKDLANTTRTPVIGPSVWDYEDIDKIKELGAKAVSFGSIFLRYPWRPTLYVRKYLKKKK
jgi:dihydroorotate dehydrogenase (NAD+) catalytic subunit